MMAVTTDPVKDLTVEADLFHNGLDILFKEMKGKVSAPIIMDTLLSAGLDMMHHEALHACADNPAEAAKMVKEHMNKVIDTLTDEIWTNETLEDSSV